MAKNLNTPRDTDDWYACPSCGSEVLVGSHGCSRCVSDVREEWAQENYLDGLDLPDQADAPDTASYYREHHHWSSHLKPSHLSWFWWLVGVGLLVSLAGFSFVQTFWQ